MSKSPSILFVERSRVLHKMVEQLCGDLDLTYRRAQSTGEALGAICKEAPTAIVAGMEQSDYSAISLVAALKSDRWRARLPIAVLTSECRVALPGLYQPDCVLCRDSEWLAHLREFLTPFTASLGQSRTAAPPRVLLVEDSATMQRLATHILHRAGCEVMLADNGRTALEILDEGSFDVVFMDIEMPVMDGREAIRRIRDSGAEVPTFALTGHAPEHFAEEARELGFDGLCPKPIRAKELREALGKGLALSDRHAPS